MTSTPAEVFDGLTERKVLVVGDLMLDRFLWGQVRRTSPEAPVPVVDLERETRSAGGAANVARNLSGLGLQVALAGVAGADTDRDRLLAELTRADLDTDGVLTVSDRGTTVKTRLVSNQRQIARIDQEQTAPLSQRDREHLLATATAHLAQADALLLSDYAKGVLSRDLCQTLIASARSRGLPVLVDPKGKDFDRYAGATLITPNRNELALATGVPAQDLDALLVAGSTLRETLHLEALVLTLSEQGMVLIGPDGHHRLPAMTREVCDVSGAGDTVIATFAAALIAGLEWPAATHLANLAAGIVVGKVGTAVIESQELATALAAETGSEQATKIHALEAARTQVRRWQADGKQIVFTNGCFDLLHLGHVTYLEQARRQGHRLIVGLNTDASVCRLKGPTRPLVGEADRARVLAALAAVDMVVLFDQDTPLALIEQLRPDVLVKGADYRKAQVAGAETVEAWGGRVVLVPLVENRSTTALIARLNDRRA